jgi:hypothetical protein
MVALACFFGDSGNIVDKKFELEHSAAAPKHLDVAAKTPEDPDPSVSPSFCG